MIRAPGAVAVIDPKTMKVKTSFPVPLDDCAGPQGMAIGPDNQILLGCNAASPDGHRNTVVINANNGSDLGGPPGPRRRRRSLVQSRTTATTSSLLATQPCRTVPVPFVVTGPEVLGIVDSNDTPDWTKRFLSRTQNSDTTVTPGNPRTIHSVAADPNNKQIYPADPGSWRYRTAVRPVALRFVRIRQ